MSIAKRVLIGLVTFLPLFILVGFLISAVSLVRYGENPPLDESVGFFIGIAIFYLLLFVTAIINIIIYINHTVKNRRIDDNAKVLWLCLLFFFNLIVMMIYYFVYIVTDKPQTEDAYLES